MDTSKWEPAIATGWPWRRETQPEGLQDVLASYQAALAAGTAPDVDALIAAHPEWADELRAFLGGDKTVVPPAEPSRLLAAAGGSPATQAESTPQTAAVARFGDYELLHEIARGGMGVVYKARQVSLNRLVALKMILPGQVATPAAVRRFHSEAEAAARLDHPNIVPIYEVGEREGHHYFSMKLVEGTSLDAELPRFIADPRASARMLAQVARAVHHAHQRGILHRDLKPANVLLAPLQGPEVLRMGPLDPGRWSPLVADFGLAKRVDADGRATASQAVVGTAGYMAPEQAEAGQKEITTVADVYSLGAILFELLTGQPPFQGATFLDTLIQALEKEPPRPRTLNPRADRDLEAVCLRCLEKEPAKRYHSAEALAQDLDRYLAVKPVSVRPWGRVERFRHWRRRNQMTAALVGLILLLLVATTLGSTLAALRLHTALRQADANAAQERQARAEADAAHQEVKGLLARAEQARQAEAERREENRRLLVRQYTANGARLLDEGDAFASLVWFAQALCHDESDAAQAGVDRVRLAAILRNGPRLLQVWRHDGPLAEAVFSRDGRRVLLAAAEGTVRVWDVTTGKPACPPLLHQGGLSVASFSPDGRAVLTAGADGTARIWDATTGKSLVPPLRHGKEVRHAAFSPDGRRVLTVGDGTVRLWDAVTGRAPARQPKPDYAVDQAAFSPDGRHLLIAGAGTIAWQRDMRIWDLNTGRIVVRFPRQTQPLRWAGFSADGHRVLTVNHKHVGRAWDARTGHPIGHLVPNLRAGRRAFSLDGRHAVAAQHGIARVVEIATGKPLPLMFGHSGDVQMALFTPDGRHVFTSTADRTARVWDAVTGQPLTPPLRQGQRMTRAVFSHYGHRLLTVGNGRTVRVWDLTLRGLAVSPCRPTIHGRIAAHAPDGERVLVVDDGRARVHQARGGKALTPVLKHRHPVTEAAFSPDGRRVLTADREEARVWDAATGEAVTPALKHGGSLLRLGFTPDGSHVAVIGRHGMHVWDATTGEALDFAPTAGTFLPRPAALSPDGLRVVRARQPLALELHDRKTGKRLGTPLQHAAPVVFATFSPDGLRLATACADGNARVWDTGGRPLTPPLPHGPDIRFASFSLDGRFIVTAGTEGVARVWDAATGLPVTPPLPHGQALSRVGFTPNHQRLMTVTKDGTIRLWDLTAGPRSVADLIAEAEVLAVQRLDPGSGSLVPLDAAGFRTAWARRREGF